MTEPTIILPQTDSERRVPDLKELWRYRGLVGLLVRRDLVVRTKQSVLGPLWLLLVPLLTTVVFTVVFNRMAGLPTDEQPPFLFYLAGVTAWGLFSGSFRQIASFFVDNLDLLTKVYVPRLCLPLAVLGTRLATFGLHILLLLLVLLLHVWTGALSDWTVHPIAFLASVLQLSLLALGFGLIVAAATVKYRDVLHVLDLFVNLWLYATPVIYPGSMIPDGWRWILWLNPVAAPLETMRHALVGGTSVGLGIVAASWLWTLLALWIGIRLFAKVERTFADTL